MTHSFDETRIASRGAQPRGEPSCNSNLIVLPEPRSTRHVLTSSSSTGDESRKRTSIHEAGHAVVAYAAGARVEFVELASDLSKPFLGRVLVALVPDVGHVANMRIAVAGLAAERFWCRPHRPATQWAAAHPKGDPEDFRRHAAAHHGHGFDQDAYLRLFGRAVAEARTVLKERWDAVLAVADELYERGRLTRAEFVAIIDGAPKRAA